MVARDDSWPSARDGGDHRRADVVDGARSRRDGQGHGRSCAHRDRRIARRRGADGRQPRARRTDAARVDPARAPPCGARGPRSLADRAGDARGHAARGIVEACRRAAASVRGHRAASQRGSRVRAIVRGTNLDTASFGPALRAEAAKQSCLRILGGVVRPISWASPVEEALRARNPRSALGRLMHRPGDLLRRADHLIRIAQLHQLDGLETVLKGIKIAAGRGESETLLVLASHLARRGRQWPRRVFFPKGDVLRAWAMQDRRPLLRGDAIGAIVGRVAVRAREPRADTAPLSACRDRSRARRPARADWRTRRVSCEARVASRQRARDPRGQDVAVVRAQGDAAWPARRSRAFGHVLRSSVATRRDVRPPESRRRWPTARSGPRRPVGRGARRPRGRGAPHGRSAPRRDGRVRPQHGAVRSAAARLRRVDDRAGTGCAAFDPRAVAKRFDLARALR